MDDSHCTSDDDNYDDQDLTLHIDSNHKTGRLPKNEYEIISSQRKSEKSCHKKKNGPLIPELVCSKDRDGNLLCSGCLKIIIPKKSITNDDTFTDIVIEFEKNGGIHNCCYDCHFSWYCNQCSLITVYNGNKCFITCGKSLMQQLLNPQHGGGRFSCDKNADYLVLLRNFFEKDMRRRRQRNALRGITVNIETIKKIYASPNSEKLIIEYRKHIKKCRNEMTSLDDLCMRLNTFDLL